MPQIFTIVCVVSWPSTLKPQTTRAALKSNSKYFKGTTCAPSTHLSLSPVHNSDMSLEGESVHVSVDL